MPQAVEIFVIFASLFPVLSGGNALIIAYDDSKILPNKAKQKHAAEPIKNDFQPSTFLLMDALNGGEDYELLFTIPLADYEKIKNIEEIHVIGHITPKENGKNFVTRDGQRITFKAQGWNSI